MAISLTMDAFSIMEPFRNNWYAVQIALPTILGSTNSSDLENSLTIACHSCTTPSITTDEQEMHRINDRVYVPGKSSYGTIDLSFYECIKVTDSNPYTPAGEILFNWQTLIHNPATGQQNYKKDTAGNAIIAQFDGLGNIVRTWNIYSCWPTNVKFGDLDATNGDVQSVTATLRFDWTNLNSYSVSSTK